MMSSLLLYSIKSALVQAVLYLPYVLMLRRESFFRFNRLVLLCILLLSLVLPLCNVPGMSLDRQPVVQAAQMQMLELGIPVHVLPEVQVVAEAQATHNLFTFSLFHLLTFIYIIGMVALLVMRLWQVGRLQIGLRRGALWQQEEQGVRIYCHSDDVAPFSWMRNIVISRQDWEEAGREIVLHETGHIRAFHSWDIVLLTLVQMLQWWNPLVYMLGISLRDVHEYEADSYVLGQGVSAQGYQLLLIRKAVGSGSYTFANSFNHSLTKKRIAMMKKSKSNPWMRSKALYVIPVAALALCAFATPKFVAPIEGAVSKLGGEVTEKSSDLQISEEENEKFSVEAVENVQTILSVAEPSNKQIFVNGRSVSIEELKDLDPEKITSIHVLHGDATKNLLGKEAYYIMTDDPKYANPNAGKLNYNQKTGKYEAIVDKPKEVTQDTVKKIYGTAKP
ncbi:MAG: M56 family metallopeptidase, partial [Bacteroidaceae bacterium]|nr:M56 family metallopeptidase [Bacteroidaceae bacterium]